MKLTKTQWWLMQHRVTAFWHGFGLANGLQIPKEKTGTIYTTARGKFCDGPKKDGKSFVTVSPEYMLGLLNEYITWLEYYDESWNSSKYESVTGISNETEFVENEKQFARPEIYKMIKLLQNERA